MNPSFYPYNHHRFFFGSGYRFFLAANISGVGRTGVPAIQGLIIHRRYARFYKMGGCEQCKNRCKGFDGCFHVVGFILKKERNEFSKGMYAFFSSDNNIYPGFVGVHITFLAANIGGVGFAGVPAVYS
jgi:hypothetical protein